MVIAIVRFVSQAAGKAQHQAKGALKHLKHFPKALTITLPAAPNAFGDVVKLGRWGRACQQTVNDISVLTQTQTEALSKPDTNSENTPVDKNIRKYLPKPGQTQSEKEMG